MNRSDLHPIKIYFIYKLKKCTYHYNCIYCESKNLFCENRNEKKKKNAKKNITVVKCIFDVRNILTYSNINY